MMYVTEQISGNLYDLYSSQELAEYFASQKETRVVGSANGVYYVEDATLGSITAYYVDDSGYYWMLFSTCMQFDTYRDQMIQFCTSGSID